MIPKLVLMTVIVCASVNADPVLNTFRLWGRMKPIEKYDFYHGWTNGFFLAAGTGLHVGELADCLETMSSGQAIAMIDKRYKDHPEKWSQSLGEQTLEALTVEGGPCEGKNPLR